MKLLSKMGSRRPQDPSVPGVVQDGGGLVVAAVTLDVEDFPLTRMSAPIMLRAVNASGRCHKTTAPLGCVTQKAKQPEGGIP